MATKTWVFVLICTKSMKTGLKILTGVLLTAVGLCANTRGAVVYNNSTNDLHTRLQLGSVEVGDEVLLNYGPGTPKFPSFVITNFTFQYYGESMGTNVKMWVRFYSNDGLNYCTNDCPSCLCLEPGTLLFDSGLFPVTDTPRSTLTFDTIFGDGLRVPSDFTWTVQLFNIAAGGKGGVDLYSPPTIGDNYSDYWYLSDSGWQLRTMTGLNVDFAAIIQGLPQVIISSYQAANGKFSLSFNTIAGGTYQIQVANSASAGWQTLPQITTGTGSTVTVTNLDAASASTRFYRVVLGGGVAPELQSLAPSPLIYVAPPQGQPRVGPSLTPHTGLATEQLDIGTTIMPRAGSRSHSAR